MIENKKVENVENKGKGEDFFFQKNGQKGQTLVITLFVMVIALTVGVIVSSRLISTLRNVSESDNSSRALAVAEAAIENILLLSQETLEDYINYNNCGNDCVLEILGESNYRARADVILSFAGASNEPYVVKVKEGEVYQLFLDGYGSNSVVNVCWDNNSSIYASYIYGDSGSVSLEVYAYNPVGYPENENGFSEATPLHGHTNCFLVDTVGAPKALRIKPYNEETFVYFVPAEGQDIPSQGILIKSVGRSGDAVKTVEVLKTAGAAPGYFDYVLYQKSANDPLSNRHN
ncbi:MAG TPA: type II secretion system protein [bacterium]|jgi:type II secretory pathway pseudopilin PulG|nr:type II secretion system protein [bacterium]